MKYEVKDRRKEDGVICDLTKDVDKNLFPYQINLICGIYPLGQFVCLCYTKEYANYICRLLNKE